MEFINEGEFKPMINKQIKMVANISDEITKISVEIPNFAIVSLSDKDGILPTDKYTVSEGRNKWVRVNSVSRSGTNYFYNTTFEIVEISFPNGFTNETVYTLVYNTGYEENLPTGLKQSLLAEVDYLYKLRGAPVTDFISPNAAMLSSGYSKNLIL